MDHEERQNLVQDKFAVLDAHKADEKVGNPSDEDGEPGFGLDSK